MHWQQYFADLYTAQAEAFTNAQPFRRLVNGEATKSEYDAFAERLVTTHLRSPRLLAFLYALAPPGVAASNLEHNLLEELGIEDEVAHPLLLERFYLSTGSKSGYAALEAAADDDLKRYSVDPLLYGSLKDLGLAVLAEVSSFEFMLSRVASTISRALSLHGRFPPESLVWFDHHAEVDIGHAEQALDNLAAYVEYYRFDDEDARAIVEGAFRENVFLKRYFGDGAAAVV